MSDVIDLFGNAGETPMTGDWHNDGHKINFVLADSEVIVELECPVSKNLEHQKTACWDEERGICNLENDFEVYDAAELLVADADAPAFTVTQVPCPIQYMWDTSDECYVWKPVTK